MTSRIYSQMLEQEYSQSTCSCCNVDDCQLILSGFPGNKVIIDVDRAISSTAPNRRCDYVIVVDDANRKTFLLPVEVKSTVLNFNIIKAQLEGSIHFFRKHLNQFKCFPVLVSTKLGKRDSQKLLQVKIEYPGGSKRIHHVICNKKLRWNKVARA